MEKIQLLAGKKLYVGAKNRNDLHILGEAYARFVAKHFRLLEFNFVESHCLTEEEKKKAIYV